MTHYGIINGFPNGVSSAVSFMVLKPWDERHRSVDQIIASIMPKLWAIPGVMAFAANPYMLPGSASFMPVGFELETTGSYKTLDQAMQKLMAVARKNPGLTNLDSDLKYDKMQYTVNINRNKAATMGVNMNAIGSAINIALGQPIVSNFEMAGRAYHVITQLYPHMSNTPQAINNLEVRTLSNKLVPLSNITTVAQETVPRSLHHLSQLRAAKLSANLAPGYTLGQAIDFLRNTASKTLPSDVHYAFTGTSRQFVEASGTMPYIFAFALVFIFLVLAAQFESFKDPFIVMLSVPLSTLGALLAIKLTHGTMNIYTEIGIVALIGLISKHGILIVEFANQLQAKTDSLKEAVIQAATIRLRPILMTTIAMITAAFPLALSTGAGAVSRREIGWTIIGGMLIGTFFTLFVVPTMYTLLGTKKESAGKEELLNI